MPDAGFRRSLKAELNLVDFHGSRLKQTVPNVLLKGRLFLGFQLSGKLDALLRNRQATAARTSPRTKIVTPA
ncbi:MAG: hypothetical protein WB762_32650 [Candidatus Sulfotelmatobacter sp.]